MSKLFTPGRIGSLELPNRLIRSATAEYLVDSAGRPKPEFKHLYRELARGGVGLIITGHMYIHPSGQAHPGMTGIHSDEMIPLLAGLAAEVHAAGGHVVAQINHGGMNCSRQTVAEPVAPSAIDAPFLKRPPRELTHDEIEMLIHAYGQAARRVREAGFDGVQIHGAHGYLVGQFLSPFVNRRQDEWGGDTEGRARFLREVCREVRKQVGADFPMLIKLGMLDAVEGGLTVEESRQVAGMLAQMGLDGLEISGGIGGGSDLNVRPGVRTEEDEGYFRPLAQAARSATTLPIALVGGFRSRSVMEDVLESGDADFISLCRPLICEPDLPRRLREGEAQRSACISANLCWPKKANEGVACRCNLKADD